jgi:hypothetical protein
VSYRRLSALAGVVRRGAAALMMGPALILAALERLPWQRPRRTETMLFCGRKPAGGA